MRKFLLTTILFILSISTVFADNVILYGMNKDTRCQVNQNGQIVTESISASDGAQYEVSAVMNNDIVDYKLIVRNATNFNFLNNTNYLNVYQGNFDKDSWSRINYTVDPVQPVGPATTYNNDTDSSLSPAEFCIVAGTVCLCSIAMWDLCDSIFWDDSPKHHHSRRHPGHTIWIDPIIEVEPSRRDTVRNVAPTTNNILMSQSNVISSDYTVAFHSNAGYGPDYKVSINTGTEVLDYYFLRSDRNSKSATSYSGGDDGTYHSITALVTVPDLNRFGLAYIYSGDPIGFYIGAQATYLDMVPHTDGKTYDSDFDNVITASGYKYNAFDDSGKIPIKDVVSLDTGIDIKLNSFMWLLAGCTFEFNKNFYYGDIYGSDNKVDYDLLKSNCYIQDEYVNYIPHLGINFVSNYVDIGGIIRYSPKTGVKGDVILGIAF